MKKDTTILVIVIAFIVGLAIGGLRGSYMR